MSAMSMSPIGEILAICLSKTAPFFELHRSDAGSATLKEDGSLVTEVDLAVEKNLESELARLFPTATFLSEEQSQDSVESFAAMCRRPTMLCLDPIDGTNNFFNGFPMYAVSLGALRVEGNELHFGEGAVYCPPFQRLYYTSGSAVMTRELGNEKAEVVQRRAAAPLSENDIVFLNLSFYSHLQASSLNMEVTTPSPRTTCSTVMDGLYTALGNGAGLVTAARLWDLAAILPIANRLGCGLFEYATGKEKTSFSVEDFLFGKGRPWQLACPHLLCHREKVDDLRRVIINRDIDFSKLPRPR